MANLSSDLEHVSLSIQKDSLELPLPAGRTSSWSPSPDEDPGLLPFSPAEHDPSTVVSESLPFPASSLEKGKIQDDSDDSAEPEMLCSTEHPWQFFAEAQRLREQKLLLDEEVSVGGQVYGVHRVILAAVSSLFRGRLVGGEGQQPGFSLEVTPRGWEAALTFAYEGVLGPASRDEVLAAAEALGAPRVKNAAQLRSEGLGKARDEEKKLSQAEELRENLHSIERLYRQGIGCDLELEAEGYRLRGEGPWGNCRDCMSQGFVCFASLHPALRSSFVSLSQKVRPSWCFSIATERCTCAVELFF